MSNSRNIGQDAVGVDLNDIMSLSINSKKEERDGVVDGVDGVAKFASEFMGVIDAADATGQAEVGREALKRLAAAGAVKGALQGHELRGLALRLANHGELTRLGGLVNNLISVGLGREAAFAAALLGDNALMEKSWNDTGMLAEAVLHAHAHGRTTLRSLVQSWNKTLQKEMEHGPANAILEEPKLTSLADAAKKPPIQILPPGMPSIDAPLPGIQKKPSPSKSIAADVPPITPTPEPEPEPKPEQEPEPEPTAVVTETAAAVPLENQTPDSSSIPVVDTSLNSSTTVAVRQELPMIDWT